MKTIYRLIFTIFLLTLFGCRHARVILPPPVPEVCRDATSPAKMMRCDSEKARIKFNIERNEAARVTKTFRHKFYFWGLMPKKHEYNGKEICPNGVREIHEFSTWKDGLLAEVTLGIYMPRTMEITCY